jgi:hypothetical protein
MNTNPVAARLAKQRKRQRGTLEELLCEAWRGVEAAAAGLAQAITVAERCSTVHALSSMAATYGRLLAQGEFEPRLALMERQVKELLDAQ